MRIARILGLGAAAVATLAAADVTTSFEAAAGKAPAMVAIEYRLRAAQALAERYPAQSRALLDEARAALRQDGVLVAPTSSIGRLMQELAPSETVKVDQNVRREPADATIAKRIGTMRSLATDADRAKLVLEVAPQIQ